jgi:hypothetical protein
LKHSTVPSMSPNSNPSSSWRPSGMATGAVAPYSLVFPGSANAAALAFVSYGFILARVLR